MLQAGAECSAEMMHKLCQKIYTEKQCPVDWGKAIIVPIHMKNDKKECSNYRRISLLSIPSRQGVYVDPATIRREYSGRGAGGFQNWQRYS